MDTLRGKLLPVLLAMMAATLWFLGGVSKDDAMTLASRAQAAAIQPVDGVVSDSEAPRAQGEARKRAFLKRAQEANIQGTALQEFPGCFSPSERSFL